MQRPRQRRKKSSVGKPYRNFYIYVSGAYEKVYMHALHQLCREKLRINLYCSEYGGGGDFRSGINELKKDLKFKRTKSVTRNLEKSEVILIQGDMDVTYARENLERFEYELKSLDDRCKIVPSIINFESWLKAHFVDISNQNEITSKQDIDRYISRYSDNTSNAKQYFDRQLQWEMVQRAMNIQRGNSSFRKFMMVFFDDGQ
jgi:hypothetical protein